MNEYQFQYKGITYECVGEDKEWQIVQFKFCIEQMDWNTLENRITNQLKHWGPSLKEVTEKIEIKEETPTKFW